jgi:hypothetical protein
MGLFFKDSGGREWNCKITVGTAKRVKEATGCDLGNMLADKMAPMREIAEDCTKLLGVIWEIIKPQAVKAGVSFDDFADAIDGDILEAVGDTFVDAIADFSAAPLRAKILAVKQKGKELVKAESDQFSEALAKLDPEEIRRRREVNATKAVDRLMDHLSGGSSIDPPESSDVIPIRSP